MIFVDTNYFLRFLLKDDDNQYLVAKKLFLEAASGKVKLISSTIVFFEIYWVLSPYYQKNKAELVRTMKKLLELTFINLDERAILEKSLYLFEDINLSFEDCYNLIYPKERKVSKLATFDRKLNRQFKELKD